MPRKTDVEIRPRIRVIRDGEVLLGPGKADLLEAIERAGSIRQAAAEMGMSYMRAWTLVKAMNEGFSEPVVESARGGARRGGASLTPTGRLVLDLYREMQREALHAAGPAKRRLEKLMR
jgi:molybdate transport system regulatory protein